MCVCVCVCTQEKGNKEQLCDKRSEYETEIKEVKEVCVHARACVLNLASVALILEVAWVVSSSQISY